MTDWQNIPFIDYLNSVDNSLELGNNGTSNQEEIETIAFLQEENASPKAAALEILRLQKIDR